MATHRIHLDSPAEHSALMAQLCRQAAAGLARQMDLTNDPLRCEALLSRMRRHEEESERYRRIAEELRKLGPPRRGANLQRAR
jgi:hypothetical protein